MVTETLLVALRALLAVSAIVSDWESVVLKVTWNACLPWSAVVKV